LKRAYEAAEEVNAGMPAQWVNKVAEALNRDRKAVIGLGYVGLPLAVVFAEAGFRTTGIDVDRSNVAAVNAG
jgi:UDP-N-acetyl-D-glucosamine dehydrogenase